jgi:type II secretory pathway component GspD/PulD (secretin)
MNHRHPAHSPSFTRISLSVGIVLLTFLSITRAATTDPKTPQILIQAKFVEVSSGGEPPVPVQSEFVLPAPLDSAKKAPALRGILTDPQFQKLIRTLAQKKGVDLLSAPQLTTKAGQQAKVEVVREFAYKDKSGKPVSQNCGVTLAVRSKLAGDNQIDVKATPQIVEFEGFINHKNGWKEPRFNENKMTANNVVTSGNTIVLEMNTRTDEQLVQDTDGANRVISSKTVLYKKRLLVFITAYLVDPATGKPRLH